MATDYHPTTLIQCSHRACPERTLWMGAFSQCLRSSDTICSQTEKNKEMKYDETPSIDLLREKKNSWRGSTFKNGDSLYSFTILTRIAMHRIERYLPQNWFNHLWYTFGKPRFHDHGGRISPTNDLSKPKQISMWYCSCFILLPSGWESNASNANKIK